MLISILEIYRRKMFRICCFQISTRLYRVIPTGLFRNHRHSRCSVPCPARPNSPKSKDAGPGLEQERETPYGNILRTLGFQKGGFHLWFFCLASTVVPLVVLYPLSASQVAWAWARFASKKNSNRLESLYCTSSRPKWH